MSTEQQFRRIQDKLQQLLKEHAALQKENQQLRSEIAVASRRQAEQQKTVDELKQQVSVLKINTAGMSETDKKEFEKRINGYLKEIDRCIALLGE